MHSNGKKSTFLLNRYSELTKNLPHLRLVKVVGFAFFFFLWGDMVLCEVLFVLKHYVSFNDCHILSSVTFIRTFFIIFVLYCLL